MSMNSTLHFCTFDGRTGDRIKLHSLGKAQFILNKTTLPIMHLKPSVSYKCPMTVNFTLIVFICSTIETPAAKRKISREEKISKC